MAKFQVGQIVKYVGREGYWSPAKGTIGRVLRLNRYDNEFLVDFPKGSIVGATFDANFWFNEDELEPVDELCKPKRKLMRYWYYK